MLRDVLKYCGVQYYRMFWIGLEISNLQNFQSLRTPSGTFTTSGIRWLPLNTSVQFFSWAYWKRQFHKGYLYLLSQMNVLSINMIDFFTIYKWISSSIKIMISKIGWKYYYIADQQFLHTIFLNKYVNSKYYAFRLDSSCFVQNKNY